MIAAQDKNTPNGAFHVDVSLLQANLDTAGFWWGYGRGPIFRHMSAH